MWVELQQKAPFIIINFLRVPPSHDYNTLRGDLHIYHPFLSYIFLKALVLSEEGKLFAPGVGFSVQLF